MPPADRVARAAEALAAAEQHLRDAVAQARAEGATWSQIGAVLGITKQAAHERFSRKPDRELVDPQVVDRRKPRRKPDHQALAEGSRWLGGGS